MNIEKTKLNNLKETENELINPGKGIIKLNNKLYGVKYYTDISEINGLIHNILVYPVIRQELEGINQYLEPFNKDMFWRFGTIKPMTMKILEDEIDYWFNNEIFEWIVPIVPKKFPTNIILNNKLTELK